MSASVGGHGPRVWVDIENPPQVQYLLPFVDVFREAGADVVVTARDYGFALDLLRQQGVDFVPVGTSLGRSTREKIQGTFERARELRAVLSHGRRPDVVLSASRAASLTARGLGIPSFIIADYEHSHVTVYRLTGTAIFYPSVIDPSVMTSRGISPRQLLPFVGLKEDITFAGVDLDAVVPHRFEGLDGAVPRVLFRPPAEESHYYRTESGQFALDVLARLARRDDLVVVYSPRLAWQEDYVERYEWKRDPVVLGAPVESLSLLRAVDAVVSSGGTMLREAAYLGIPALSIFRSAIGGVDRYLESVDRLRLVSTPAEFDEIRFDRATERRALRSNPDVLAELSTVILSAAAGGRRAARSGLLPWVPPPSVRVATGAEAPDVVVASTRLAVLDHFKVPYAVGPHARTRAGSIPLERLSSPDGARSVYWISAAAASTVGATPCEGAIGRARVFGSLVPDKVVKRALAALGGRWTRGEHVGGDDHDTASSVWRSEAGDVFLPFDMNDTISAYWHETYRAVGSLRRAHAASRVIRSVYYPVRPVIPRRAQLALRRAFTRAQERVPFPAWPIELSLNALFAILLEFVDEVAGYRVPRIAAWPHGKEWALVLTHDVEHQRGLDHLGTVLELERRLGLRSAIFCVPERDYVVGATMLERLESEGFEVGLHGLRHDGFDVTRARFPERLPQMHRYAERWQAAGFRSPSTNRDWSLMPLLHFDYDSSSSDTAPYEPTPGGCCWWRPFFVGSVLELPMTLAQDHTLFELLGHRDESAWVGKATFLRERGGMALLLTHPDYLLEGWRLDAYRRFLERFAGDETAWHALPREVSAWWRRRAASHVERDGDGWRVVGPAAGEARVESGPLP